MAADAGFYQTLGTGIIGFILFVASDLLLKPIPSFKRPISAWFAAFGVWAILYALMVIILGRVWCACAACLSINLVVILVSNAKQKSMREPFLFQDYDYFLDTLRFPRLFLPFLGLKSFCVAAFFCILAIGAIMLEKPFAGRWQLDGQLGAVIILLAGGWLSLNRVFRRPVHLSLEPAKDFHDLGLTAFLFLYGLQNISMPVAKSPFTGAKRGIAKELPNLVAFQSESFFDPRPLMGNIPASILKNFDALSAKSFSHGNLHVPAWGANTARTEFSFLTGIAPDALGMHRFNPYQTMLRGWRPASLPKFLKELGYHTICAHPYHSAFYGRKKIFPEFGFDEFMDINAFSARDGAYISDLELGQKIVDTVAKEDKPIFIFAISMENHGPLHLEKQPEPQFIRKYLPGIDPDLCPEMPVYLRHLKHTDELIAFFWEQWSGKKPISLCFYGDHVPIMPNCYKNFGYPAGDVPYLCWANFEIGKNRTCAPEASDLAMDWLESLGIATFEAGAARENAR